MNNAMNLVGDVQNSFGNGDFSDMQNQMQNFANSMFEGVDLNALYSDFLGGASSLKDSQLFSNIPKDKVPFDLENVSGIEDLSNKFIENAGKFNKTEIKNLIDNLSSNYADNDQVKAIFESSTDVLKGTHAFGKFFKGMKMEDMLNDAAGVFRGISDGAKDALKDVDFDGGYDKFLQKLNLKKDSLSEDDKEKIISQFEELDSEDEDWGATMSRQVEVALNGTPEIPSSTNSQFVVSLVILLLSFLF